MRRPTLGWLGWGLFAAAALILPVFIRHNQFWLGTMITIWITTLNAQSWNVIAGYGGQWSLGQTVFFGVGAYTVALTFARLGLSPWLGLGLALVAAMLVSWVVGRPTFRLRGHYFSLATLAAALAFEAMAKYFESLTGGDFGISVPLGQNWLNMQWRSNVPYYYVGLALVLLGTLAVGRLDRSALGLRLRAIRDNEEAAESVGVGALAVKLQALAISACLAAAAGALFVMYLKFLDPRSAFGLGILVQTVLVSIAGGMGTVAGPLVGALLMVPVGEWTNAMFGGLRWAGLQYVIYGLILMLLILVLPDGIVGWWQKARARR